MSLYTGYQSNSNPSHIRATKYNSTTPTNHLFGPDGLILGVTYPKPTHELTNFHNTGSYINYEERFDSNSSCTIL